MKQGLCVYVFLLLGAFSLAGCAMQRAQDAGDAQRAMAGMTKEQVFACMGLPKRKGTEGSTEIWSYKSGNSRTEKSTSYGSVKTAKSALAEALSSSFGLEDEVREKRYCVVQVVFTEGRVKAVNYSGPTGGFLTGDEQCAYATRNCLM